MTETTFYELLDGYLPPGAPSKDWSTCRQDRTHLQFLVYKEKDPDANPYYASNDILKLCAGAAETIINRSGPYACQGELAEMLQKIANAKGLPTDGPLETACLLKTSEEPFLREFGYFASHHITKIQRIAGGHRGPIQNDTEIYLDVSLLPGADPAQYLAEIEAICHAAGVSCRLTGAVL